MKLDLTDRFQAALLAVDRQKRARVLEAMLALPKALGSPHEHSGLGLRKVHSQGYWEIRAGMDLRVLFRLEPDAAVLEFVGTHEDIQRYLRRL